MFDIIHFTKIVKFWLDNKYLVSFLVLSKVISLLFKPFGFTGAGLYNITKIFLDSNIEIPKSFSFWWILMIKKNNKIIINTSTVLFYIYICMPLHWVLIYLTEHWLYHNSFFNGVILFVYWVGPLVPTQYTKTPILNLYL